MVRIGISVTSFYDVEDPREGVWRMLERVRTARRARLDSLFVGDHHATPRPYYQNVPILGRLLAEWDDRPAGALFLLPLWHPVLLAEQVGTLASIAPGPFVLQCGLGDPGRQFDAMGAPASRRAPRFEECLDLARRLWSGEEVSSAGHWPIERAHISPVPPRPVEVWIGAVAPAAIDRAARLGDGWIAAPHLVPDEAGRQLETYRERCLAHGREPGAAVIRRDVYVGATDDEAFGTTGKIIEAGYRGFSPEALIVGSPERVAFTFRQLDELGYDEILVRSLVPVQELACRSIDRLAQVRELLD